MADPNSSTEAFGAAGRYIDPMALARRSARLGSTRPVSEFERLGTALVDSDGQVQWAAAFGQVLRNDGMAQNWLTLSFAAPVQVACSLCAEPMAVELNGEGRFLFVRNEEEAARLDELAEDYDVLAAGERFDLMDLIEDELILAVPLLAHHDICPADAADEAADEEETQQPFAGLAATLAAANKPKKPKSG